MIGAAQCDAGVHVAHCRLQDAQGLAYRSNLVDRMIDEVVR
jgi:hypothetical protein